MSTVLCRSAAPLAAAFAVPAAHAEVIAAQPAGCSTRTEVSIAAPPSRVYERVLEIGRWWNDEHTYSGAAARMTLEARPGGCWCEALENGGFIEHGRVVYVATGKTLRMTSALGPLHEVGGGTGTKLTLTYVGTGFEPQKGLASMAPLFDGVLSEQMQRLKRYVETGRPAPAVAADRCAPDGTTIAASEV